MSTTRSHYDTLGVLPDAPDIVIRAAYKALAQRYHPDKVDAADKQEAHTKMAAINAAYAVLSDPARRSSYDETLRSSKEDQSGFDAGATESDDFVEAMREREDSWKVAVTIYPEAAEVLARLQRISRALAFAYMVAMLEGKQFDFAKEIGAHMEEAFLKRHFGSNPQILAFASTLIFAGRRDAALELNKIIGIVGSSADPKRIIGHIEAKFDLSGTRSAEEARQRREAERAPRRQAEMQWVRERFLRDRNYINAQSLARAAGYRVEEAGGSTGVPPKIWATKGSESSVFPAKEAFITWVARTLLETA